MELASNRHDLFLPGVGAPNALTVSQQFYLKGTGETLVGWSPYSFTEDRALERVFFGGSPNATPLGQFQTPAGLTRFVTFGQTAGSSHTLIANPFSALLPFPTNQWFTLMCTLSQDSSGSLGYGLWIKTNESVTNNFLDPRMTSGDVVPIDKDPVGWVNLYPGAAAGIGLARDANGFAALTTGLFGLAPLGARASTVSGVKYFWGGDLPPADAPNPPEDVFFDSYCVNGDPPPTSGALPLITKPYVDDIESYTPNTGFLLAVSTAGRWTDVIPPVGDHSFITTLVSASATNSVGTQNNTGDNVFKPTIKTFTPSAVAPTAGDPVLIEAKMYLSSAGGGAPRTSRAIVLSNSGQKLATINLGARDPSTGIVDGQVWVLQPNSAFNSGNPDDSSKVQGNSIPDIFWAIPHPGSPLNTRMKNFRAAPAGLVQQLVTPNVFHTVRIEIDPVKMRLFFDGVELFPTTTNLPGGTGNSALNWVAGAALCPDTIEFWSGAELLGTTELLSVDDVKVFLQSAPPCVGPPFALPYADDFELYPVGAPIFPQADTPFLDTEATPLAGSPDVNEPNLELTETLTTPAPGQTVCRYQLGPVSIAPAGFPAPGSVLAVIDDLPPTLDPADDRCPGVVGVPTDFDVLDATGARTAHGDWTLFAEAGSPFDPLAGDATGFAFNAHVLNRYRTPGSPMDGVVTQDVVSGNVLTLTNRGGIYDPGFGMFTVLDATLPAAHVVTPTLVAPTGATVSQSFDIFIESLDATGAPVVAAPRTRFAVPVVGAGPDGGRITAIMFGGPNVNRYLQDNAVPPAIIPADEISFAVADPGGSGSPVFVSTGVSLVTGGSGITGPLVNTWFRCTITLLDGDGSWELSIDEDRDGPAPAVVVVTGAIAIDQGLPTASGAIADTSSIDAFGVLLGRDLGGGGEPTPTPIVIEPLDPSTPESATPPPGANATADWCFYEIDGIDSEGISPLNIFHVDPQTGALGADEPVRSGDVLAVFRGAGSPLPAGDPCPLEVISGVDFFRVQDLASTEIVSGRWTLMGQTGAAGVVATSPPAPVGGVANSLPPYNSGAPFRAMVLGVFQAAPTFPPVRPASRWLLDNLTMVETTFNTPPCTFADLSGDGVVDGTEIAFVLNDFGNGPNGNGNPIGFPGADINSDGVVDGVDLAIVLNSFGPCP